MPKLDVTDEQVDAYVAEHFGGEVGRNTPEWRSARKHLAREAFAAITPTTPPATEPAHLTITTEVSLGGVVIGVTSSVVPIPEGITAP